nr:MAG TPA: hypothetical protein [Caudoviricetes sp.]
MVNRLKIISRKTVDYKIEKSEDGYFIIMYKIPRYGVWCEVENAKFKTAIKAETWFKRQLKKHVKY